LCWCTTTVITHIVGMMDASGDAPGNTVNAEPHGTRASTYMRTSEGAFEENQQRHFSPATSRRLEHRRTHRAAATGTHSPVAPLPYGLYAACASPPALPCPQHFSAHSPASLNTARFSAHRRTQRASLHRRASLHTPAHSALLLLLQYCNTMA
jgi:hypothetical protein